jgi:hypothetical protein
MAIITTPLFPGQYVWRQGKALIFTRLVKEDIVRHSESGWTKTVQQTRKPHDPQTQPQLGVRALIRSIAKTWHDLTPDEKQTWLDLADSITLKPFLAYTQYLVARWMNLQPPTRAYPAEETSSPISITAHAYTGGKRFATLSITPSSDDAIFGVLILRSPSPITTPTYRQAIALIPVKTAATISFTDSPLPPETYHYRAAVYNTDGTMGPVLADESVSVF